MKQERKALYETCPSTQHHTKQFVAAAEVRLPSLIALNSNGVLFISLLAQSYFQIELISPGHLFFDLVVYGYVAPLKHPCHLSFAFTTSHPQHSKELWESNYLSPV